MEIISMTMSLCSVASLASSPKASSQLTSMPGAAFVGCLVCLIPGSSTNIAMTLYSL